MGFWVLAVFYSLEYISIRIILKYNREILLVMMDTTNIEDNNSVVLAMSNSISLQLLSRKIDFWL